MKRPSEPHLAMSANADNVVSLAGYKRIRQIDDIQGDVAISPLLIQRIPIHKESASHNGKIARSPRALPLLFCRSLLESLG